MWIIDLWRFKDGQPVHEARSQAEDKESALDEARSALDLDRSVGVTVYTQDSSGGFPTPVSGQVVVED